MRTLYIFIFRYKAEVTIDCDPETVFSYIDPTPDGPRAKWDKAVKELELVERIDKVILKSVQDLVGNPAPVVPTA